MKEEMRSGFVGIIGAPNAGKSTLTIRIYSYLHYGASATVAGLSFVLVLSLLLISAGILLLSARWSKISSSAGREK